MSKVRASSGMVLHGIMKTINNLQDPTDCRLGVGHHWVLAVKETVGRLSPKRLLTGSSKELMPLSAEAIDNLQDPTDCGLGV